MPLEVEMKKFRVVTSFWIGWMSLLVWGIHPFVHSHSWHLTPEAFSAHAHSHCEGSTPHPKKDFPHQGGNSAGCELCAANGEVEPLEVNEVVNPLLVPIVFNNRLGTDQVSIPLNQPLLTGSLSFRGPPSPLV